MAEMANSINEKLDPSDNNDTTKTERSLKLLASVRRKTKFTIGQITKHNIEVIREIHRATLPIKYSDKLYETISKLHKYSRLAYIGEVPVGAIVCRSETDGNSSEESKKRRLYVMTLSALEPYRNLGCGSFLLDYILRLASSSDFYEIYLHVWTTNHLAINFYRKKDFQVREQVREYYPDIDPPDALLLFSPLPYNAYTTDSEVKVNYDASVHNVHVDC